MFIRDQHLHKSPAIEVYGHCRLPLPWLRVHCWFFCNPGLKNCWHRRKGIEPTTLDLNSLRSLWPLCQGLQYFNYFVPHSRTFWYQDSTSAPDILDPQSLNLIGPLSDLNVYKIKGCHFINEQFSIDSFLDWEGLPRARPAVFFHWPWFLC